MEPIQVKKLDSRAVLPTRGSAEAAGCDLYACLACERVTIPPHGTARLGTGLAFALPAGTFGAVFARSGLATKEALRPANCVGVVDSDYRGELMVALHNDGETARTVTHGERIAQLVLLPYLPMSFEETAELPETRRGSGGFGSTGA
ncbi:MAG: dUTP diphosphatase [Oscillospiraceae bacterium]|nr:dUTP diphosphatase [Oscillospiraceae bacterium]